MRTRYQSQTNLESFKRFFFLFVRCVGRFLLSLFSIYVPKIQWNREGKISKISNLLKYIFNSIIIIVIEGMGGHLLNICYNTLKFSSSFREKLRSSNFSEKCIFTNIYRCAVSLRKTFFFCWKIFIFFFGGKRFCGHFTFK